MTTIVADCSAVAQAILRGESAADSGLLESDLHAPELLDFELLSVVRRNWQLQKLSEDAADIAIAAFFELAIVRHPLRPLADRVWSLRHNVSAYDASYVALAEALDAPLLTSDMRLARAAEPYCEVVIVR